MNTELISFQAHGGGSGLHIPARPRCALKQLSSVEKEHGLMLMLKENGSPCAPTTSGCQGAGGPDGAAAGQVQSFLSGTEARRIKWRLCHCSTMSTASGSSRWNMHSRINTGQRDVSGEGTYGRTLANPAVWLGQKRLTKTDRRPGQDCSSSLSQGPGSITFPHLRCLRNALP